MLITLALISCLPITKTTIKMAAVWGMSPLLRENISASDMEGIISVETRGEERGRLKKMDTSFTVCRQSDGTILRYAEYEPRYSE